MLWVAFAVTVLALPFAVRAVLNLDVNLFNQASDKLERFRLLKQLSQDFGGDLVAAVLYIPDNPSPQQVKELKAFAQIFRKELIKVGTLAEDHAVLPDELNAELAALSKTSAAGNEPEAGAEAAPVLAPWLRQVECRTGEGIEQTMRRIARDRPYVLLKPADVDTIKKLFEPESLKESMTRVAATYAELAPNSAEAEKLKIDPLGFSELINSATRERVTSRGRALGSTDSDGFFISPDKTTLVIVGRAVLPATRLDFNRALMGATQRAENRAIVAFRATKPSLSTALKSATFAQPADGEIVPELKIGFTGMPAVAVENEMSLKYDLLGNTATSFVGILLLFLIVFRRPALAWDVTWTTALVIVWTLGVAGLTHGSISIMGGAFTCILLGTGTDYAIHLQNAFYGFRHEQGLEIEEALRQTLMRCGPGIITASLTTALAFLGVAFTSFVGLAEFGLLAGISVLFGCIMMLTVFPALLARPSTVVAEGPGKSAPPALGMGLPQWGRLLEIRSVQIASLGVGIVSLLGAFYFIRFGVDPGPERVAGVRFDPEIGNLRSLRIKAIPLRERLSDRFKLGLADVRVIIEAPDEESAYAAAEVATQRLQPFITRGELSAGGSVLDFVPSIRQQQLTIAALKTFDFEAARAAFEKAATERFGPKGMVFFKPFREKLHNFGLLTREPTPLTLAMVMNGPLSNMLSPFVSLPKNASSVKLSASFFPKNLKMPATWYDDLARAVETDVAPTAKVRITAARMVGSEMKESLLYDCGWISLLVGICVLIALGVAFRSPYTSMLAMVPLVYAYTAMLAGVSFAQWMGWEFSLNFVNLIMFPLLLGSGIDVGIYMVYEAISPRRPSIAELMSDTGRSVLCCTLTTLVGFGSFFWSSYTGLISLGIAAIFGYSGALLGALVVLPAIIALFKPGYAAPPAHSIPKEAAKLSEPVPVAISVEQTS